jgi:hypothetical protein
MVAGNSFVELAFEELAWLAMRWRRVKCVA